MKKHVPLKATVCFSVYNGSCIFKETTGGFKGKILNYLAFKINNIKINILRR